MRVRLAFSQRPDDRPETTRLQLLSRASEILFSPVTSEEVRILVREHALQFFKILLCEQIAGTFAVVVRSC